MRAPLPVCISFARDPMHRPGDNRPQCQTWFRRYLSSAASSRAFSSSDAEPSPLPSSSLISDLIRRACVLVFHTYTRRRDRDRLHGRILCKQVQRRSFQWYQSKYSIRLGLPDRFSVEVRALNTCICIGASSSSNHAYNAISICIALTNCIRNMLSFVLTIAEWILKYTTLFVIKKCAWYQVSELWALGTVRKIMSNKRVNVNVINGIILKLITIYRVIVVINKPFNIII